MENALIAKNTKGVPMAARLLTALFALVMLASSMVPPSGLLSNDASAESLPSWTRTFHLHEGAVYSTSYYDWLNSSGPYNPSWTDYDGDGSMGISIRKWNPSEHWRHHWVLDPAVNSQVQILGDMSAYVWAKSRDNESGTLMTVIFSDCAPGQLADPSLWTEIGTVTIPLQGPIYSEFKLYNATVAGVDYLLDPDHQLVMTVRRGDSLNDALQVMYDQNIYDSYIRFPTTTFISADAVWTEDSTGSARSVFSDGEDVIVLANVSNPFGTYEIVGVDAEVAYSSNGTVALGPVSMTLSRTDASSNPAWSVFSTLLVGLENGTYDITVYAYDPQGSPTWLSCSISVVTADHFAVSAPFSVLVDTAFTMTVSARDASDAVIPNWVGTVSLASYLEDAVSPSAGSLSVTSVDITASDGGQVTIPDQIYDYAEETILIRASSNSHFGWSSPVTVRAGPVVDIEISPSSLVIFSGDSREFTAVGRDSSGFTNNSWTPNWTLAGDIGSITGSGFTITFSALGIGVGAITCTDDETSASDTALITVNPGILARIEIVPAGPLTIREGQSEELEAFGYDNLGNPVAIPGAIWSTNTSGQVTGFGPNAVYTAGYIPEVGSVEVRVGSISDTLAVTVINALDGPWLGTIPMQISTEDSNWTFSLSTYWHHANGTSNLRWYVEGVDTSLYLVIHDSASESLMKFLTQPDAFGDDEFRLWVRDPQGFSTYQDVAVSIQPVNDRPRFVNSPPTELYVKFDTAYTFDYDYYVKDVDNPRDELRMLSDFPDNVFFDRLIGTFIFPKDPQEETYFEIVEFTLTDALEGETVDGTNSDSLNTVVRVTEDAPPALNESLPDVTLYEGEIDHFAFDLDLYFFDIDSEYLVYTYGFINIVIDILENHEVYISAPTEWSGSTEGTLTATDPIGALKTDTIVVTVIAVNDAPVVADIETVHVRYDTATYLDVALYVSDADHTLDELAFDLSSSYVTYADGFLELLFPANLTGAVFTELYIVTVAIEASDPLGASGANEFEVLVSDNYSPAVVDPVPYYDLVSFPEDTYLNNSIDLSLLFYDQDDEEFSYFFSGNTNIQVTVYSSGVVNFTALANWSGFEAVVFKVFDPHGAWASWQVTVYVIPVNDAPVALPIPDHIIAGGPRNAHYAIDMYFTDSETPFSELVIVAEPGASVAVVGNYLYISLPAGVDVITVTIYARDADGAESNVVTFEVGVKKTIAELIGYPYSFPLLLLAAGVAAYFLASRIPRPYALENIFLIHNDGRLMAHVTKQENTSIDKDIVSAMFTAVQEFVKDSFQAGEVGLKKLEIGDKNVMIEKGQSAYIAMIYSGWPRKDVFESLTMLLRDIEERYKGKIERWNGTGRTVKGVEPMLQSFMADSYKPGAWQAEETLGEEEWVDILDKEG